jgi:ATP-binding cassette, subfamily B, bacterial
MRSFTPPICTGAPASSRRARCSCTSASKPLLVAGSSMAQRGISLAQSLLRAQLGQRVNVMILEKALTLDLTQFEDSEFYDKLTRARREASSRPLSS